MTRLQMESADFCWNLLMLAVMKVLKYVKEKLQWWAHVNNTVNH